MYRTIMRAVRACSVDQCEKPWHTRFMPWPSGLSTYLSVKRAWRAESWPGSIRLHGVSESAGRANSSTSVTDALVGIVAHRVTMLASVSVHPGEGGGAGAGSADTP